MRQSGEISGVPENTNEVEKDDQSKSFANVDEREEKIISLPDIIEDAGFNLSKVEKNELLRKQNTDKSLEEISEKAKQKKSQF